MIRLIRNGSSPLARGLPTYACRAFLHDGIIPARAGFTLTQVDDAPTGGDHPRSRGVYGTRGTFGERLRGSSPLARGLRPRCPSEAF